MTKETKQETKFEKRTWVKGDRPGASDFNRIEDGIESAHEQLNQLQSVVVSNQEVNHQSLEIKLSRDDLAEIVKQIPKLETNAKVADVVLVFNALHDALTGAVEEGQE